MKKIASIFTLLLTVILISGCQTNENTIKVIATTTPHGEILEFIKPTLEEKGYKLDIVITSDYYLPNPSVASGDAIANFFQHVPFLNLYNDTNPNAPLVNALGVHIEPIGIYSSGINHINDIPNGSTVLISNSTSDHGRVLNLFEQAGLITLSENFDILAASIDFDEVIISNPKNLEFKADVSPDLMIPAYNNDEADLYVINSNYVIQGGYNPVEDAIFLESTTNNPYVNILAVTEANMEDPRVIALIEALSSQAVKDFINQTYGGAVIPA